MKQYFISLVLLFLLTMEGCKTETVSPTSLPLLQHKWMLVAHYGEALRYIGTPDDYYDFRSDNFLYRHIAGVYDTFSYKLLSDNRSLLLYPVEDGIESSEASHYHISVLDSAQLIMSNIDVTLYNLDSLKR